MRVGQNIKKFRRALGLSQKQLGEKLRIKQYVIASYESAKRNPPISRLPEIAKVLGVTLEELFGIKPKKISSPINHLHRNKREAKLHELYKKISPVDQREVLKNIEWMIERKNRKKTVLNN